MAEIIRDKTRLTNELYVFDKSEITNAYYQMKSIIFSLIIASAFSMLFSPVLSLFLLGVSLFLFYFKIIKKFFHHPDLINYYYKMFEPKLGKKVLSVIGYEIPESELESHLKIVNDVQELAKKQKQKQNNKSSWIGIPVDKFRTHFIIPGKTGAGKTELVRSMSNDVIKVGGGEIFNDGKSDEKMLIEVATQLKKLRRQTSFRVLNFLKPQEMSETNTLELIGSMHPLKVIQLLASLSGADDSNADANTKHFMELGKAMLSCPINALYVRRKIFKEPFNIEKVRQNMNIREMVIMYFLLYGVARDLNDIIKNNPISEMIEEYKVQSINKEFEQIDTLIYYITQRPYLKNKVKEYLGIDYIDIKEIYSNAFYLIQNYLKEIWSGYAIYLPEIANFLYYYCKLYDVKFFTLNPKNRGISYDDFVLNYYFKLKNLLRDIKTDKDAADSVEEIINEMIMKFDIKITLNLVFNVIHTGLFREKIRGGNIEEPPDDAIQQHNYATQQWTSLFTTLGKFPHIFGQDRSEIIPNKILLDNQILYNLIPVKELGDNESKIIGKISVALIDEVASQALGGKVISEHITIKNIKKEINTPKPIFLVFLDEYNSYPIAGVDKMLLQYRSLNIGVMIGIQNLAGLKVGGNDETSKENALGSSTKIFLKVEDESTIKWLDTMIEEERVLKREKIYGTNDNYVYLDSVKEEKEKKFDPRKIQRFANGCGVIFADGELVFFQSFYRGGESSTIQIPHFIPIEDSI